MAIKKLQNNFTTPEQSKRLLELGVPADSADCYYAPFTRGVQVRHEPYELRSTFFGEYPFNPCWSVGRLMEIINICVPGDEELAFTYYDDMIDGLIERIKEERVVFSKLEE